MTAIVITRIFQNLVLMESTRETVVLDTFLFFQLICNPHPLKQLFCLYCRRAVSAQRWGSLNDEKRCCKTSSMAKQLHFPSLFYWTNTVGWAIMACEQDSTLWSGGPKWLRARTLGGLLCKTGQVKIYTDNLTSPGLETEQEKEFPRAVHAWYDTVLALPGAPGQPRNVSKPLPPQVLLNVSRLPQWDFTLLFLASCANAQSRAPAAQAECGGVKGSDGEGAQISYLNSSDCAPI